MKIETKIIIGFLISHIFVYILIYILSSYIVKPLIPILLILIFVYAIILGKIFSYYILKQISMLQASIIEIIQGNLNRRVIVKNKNDEIGQVCLSFNDMISRLQNAYIGLEKKVRERTSEIEILKTSLEKRIKDRTAELENLKISLEKKVEERTQELNEKLEILEKMNRVMVNRELIMIDLKKEIEKLNNASKLVNKI